MFFALLLLSTSAAADVVKLRMASAAPDGTAWAREMRALAREVSADSFGAIEIKWYYGGLAGDEELALSRVRAGQLEGMAAGAICMRLAPSLRILRVPGMFGNWAESLYVLGRIRAAVTGEFAQSGLTVLGDGGFGNDIIFSRHPVASMADLRKGRFAFWNIDDVARASFEALGMNAVPLKIEDATHAYEAGQIDGIITMPSAALAFQWSSIVGYFSDLPLAFMPACLVVSRSVFEALPIDKQRTLREASAKFQARMNDLGQELDQRLMGGLFEHQGLKKIRATKLFRSEFFSAVQRIRTRLTETNVVPGSLMDRAFSWLADYRAEFRAK